MKVLVTGATGFVGRALCEELTARGHTVSAAVRTARSAPSGTTEIIVGDINESTNWSHALTGQEAVVHLAARVHVMAESSADPLGEFRRVNASGTGRLAAESESFGIGKFIFLSSIKVNGEVTKSAPFSVRDVPHPKDPYGLSKLEAEQAIEDISRAGATHFSVIRTPLVYGPRAGGNFLRLLKLVDNRLPIPLGGVNNSRSMISVWNLCDLIAYLLETDKPTSQLILASDRTPLSTPDLIRAIGQGLNKPARLVRLPTRLLKTAGRMSGKGPEIARLVGSLEVEVGSTAHDFAWSPPQDSVEGILTTSRLWKATRYTNDSDRVDPMDKDPDRGLRIAFITQWFPPEPTPIPLFIAQSLQRRGHSIEVLTGVPNYPTGIVSDGYSAWKPHSETVEGISVRRSPLYANHDRSALKRMLNYVSWAASTTLFQAKPLRAADVALVFSSPATAALPAMVAHRLAKTPYVLFIQDLWPDSVTAAGFIGNRRLRGAVHRILSAFTNRAYNCAEHVAVLSPGMISELERRGVASEKLSLIYNWASESLQSVKPTRIEARARFSVPEKAFVVAYAGNQGTAQGLDVVVRAASRLLTHKNILFLFFGNGTERKNLEKQAADLGCENIRFIGTIPQADMPFAQAVSDVQLVSLVADALFEITMPSKVQGILASGSPVIAVAAGDVAKVVQDSGAGWAVPPGNDEELSQRILEASALDEQTLSSMGSAGQNYYQDHMSETIGGGRLDEILRRTARKCRRR